MNTHVEESMSQKVQKTLRFILLCVLFVIFVFPFVLVIINVFKTKADILEDRIPSSRTDHRYRCYHRCYGILE